MKSRCPEEWLGGAGDEQITGEWLGGAGDEHMTVGSG